MVSEFLHKEFHDYEINPNNTESAAIKMQLGTEYLTNSLTETDAVKHYKIITFNFTRSNQWIKRQNVMKPSSNGFGFGKYGSSIASS